MVMMEKEKVWEVVVPLVAMVLMEGCTIALTITANSAMEKGMNQFVFVAYSNALSALILLPYSYIFHTHGMRESLHFKFMSRFFLLGITGITIAQNLAFTGLLYSSPIVVCAMGLLLPCFQFFLALLQGKTKVEMSRRSTKMRIVGISISFLGAAVVTTYKGPSIVENPLLKPHVHVHGNHPMFAFLFMSSSLSQQWVCGCLLLACASFFLAVWGTLQVGTFKKLPDMMVIVTWYIMLGTIQTAAVDLLAERDLSAWKLSFNLELIIIVLTATFGTFVKSRVQAWCMSKKGAMYVASFRPFGIFWACAITLSFVGSSLHYGSVVGASISGLGYYTMLWAATKEEEEEEERMADKFDADDYHLKAPLLQPGLKHGPETGP